MTRAVITVDEAAPLSEVVGVMQGKHVKRVPVLAASRLVGMVSRVDLLRALADSFTETTGAPLPSDAVIGDGVRAEFARQSWPSSGRVTVTVAHGVVDLGGVIFTEEERAGMRVAAENIAGVTSVRDHLVWVEPNSGLTIGPDSTPAE
jgi:CBS domain-containing protein